VDSNIYERYKHSSYVSIAYDSSTTIFDRKNLPYIYEKYHHLAELYKRIYRKYLKSTPTSSEDIVILFFQKKQIYLSERLTF